jgi:glycosyltransferase involved in cell wall biosynthesis
VRIAWVITRADAVGGATVHVCEMASAMVARGHQAMVFVGGAGHVTGQLAAAGAPYRSLAHLGRAIHPVRDLRALFELTAELREFRPDLVSTHTAKAGWIGRAACARLGIPAVHTPHGWPVADRFPGAQAALFEVAERVAARWAQAVVCVCEHERRLALEKGFATPERATVIYNGVRDVPQELRASPADGPVRIVSVARFEAPKDHRTLLEALARLRFLAWELDLVGDGPQEAAMRTLAAQLGLAGRVRFLGYLPDARPALAGASLFVLSSRSEAFPRSVLEAMCAGLPVVASSVGGLPEAVDNGVNGVLVPHGDAGALSAALEGLLADAARRRRMGLAARSAYESRFRLERMIAGTVEIYESVVNRHACTRTTA